MDWIRLLSGVLAVAVFANPAEAASRPWQIGHVEQMIDPDEQMRPGIQRPHARSTTIDRGASVWPEPSVLLAAGCVALDPCRLSIPPTSAEL